MAPASNTEGGGRLMLSKGIDAECGKAVPCRVVSDPRGFAACFLLSVGERQRHQVSRSPFLCANELLRNCSCVWTALPRIDGCRTLGIDDQSFAACGRETCNFGKSQNSDSFNSVVILIQFFLMFLTVPLVACPQEAWKYTRHLCAKRLEISQDV